MWQNLQCDKTQKPNCDKTQKLEFWQSLNYKKMPMYEEETIKKKVF